MIHLFWIVTTSFWRNRRQYRFFIIALMLATLVSSLGLSAVEAVASIWRLPFLALDGGHIQISARGRRSTGVDSYALFPRDPVTEIVKTIYPNAILTFTLRVPSRPLSKELIFEAIANVTGREGGRDTWYLALLHRSGETFEKTDDREERFFVRDQSPDGRDFSNQRLTIAQYDPQTAGWSFAQAKEIQPQIAGTLRYPMAFAFTHLATLQRLSQAPSDQISSIGVGLPTFNARIDPAKLAELRTALAKDFPQLEATTTDEFAAENFGDLVPIREAAKRYLPIVLGMALLVVVATALAIVQSRRRELSMLRVIGMSERQVWTLFLAESTLAALLAAAIGLFLAKSIAYLIFGGIRMSFSILDLLKTEISLLPFALSLTITIAATAVVSAVSVARAMPKVLRNA